MLRRLAVVLSILALTGCAGLQTNPTTPDPNFYNYTYEIGVTNAVGDHVAVVGDNLIVQGNGSHKGTPGIYLDGQTVLPFVNRGPCAAGSPCWTGKITIPRDGAHEWRVTGTLKLTSARWREMFDDGGTHQIYCSAKLDGVPLSILDNTGVGYAITPIQQVEPWGSEFQATCSGHN
jgi:hypothetical protein